MSIQYRVARIIIRIWLKICGHKVIGAENIPQSGAMIIAPTHNSYADPVILGATFPFQIFYMAKSDFSQNAFIRWFFGFMGAVFLKRGEADIMALKKALRMLKSNQSVGIFPEGTRFHPLPVGELKNGAAFIAYKANVPLVPVAIMNPKHIFKFWKRDMKTLIGEPIYIFNDDRPYQEIVGEYTKILKDRIVDLFDYNQ